MYFGGVTDVIFNCNGCHVLDEASGFFDSDGQTTFENEPQMFKIPHLRNAYQKVGMFGMPAVPFFSDTDNTFTGPQVRGFGFLHDGSVDTLRRFHSATVFSTTPAQNQQLEEFILAFPSNMRPIVGQQVTLTAANGGDPDVTTRLNLFDTRAGAGDCDVIVKGSVGGLQRGWVRQAGNNYRSDRASEALLTTGQIRAQAAMPGQDLTYTCVPPGSGDRMGVDRDEDGFFDRDELDAGSDPANALSIPGGTAAALIPMKKLSIKNKLPDDESGNKVIILVKSGTIATPAPFSGADPRCNGDPSGTVKASLTVSSASSGQSHSTNLPCQNWTQLGSASSPKGYKYQDPELDDGTAKKVIWKNQKQLKAILQGKGPSTLGYDLQVGVDQGVVAVELAAVGNGLCMACDDFNGHNGSDGKLFLGKDCPAPGSCP